MTTDPSTRPTAAVDKRERARRIAAVVVGALIIAFAALNLDEVKVNWILSTWQTPLILVIAVSFVLGLAAGYLVRGRHARGKSAHQR